MQWHKVHFKFPVADPKTADPQTFFKVFNDWIPDSPEIFVDVADYSHVTDGPLTVLVGNKVDCMLDNADGRAGFVYATKHDTPVGDEKGLLATLAKAVLFADRLVGDARFGGKLQINTGEIEIIVNDRALAPNTSQTFQNAQKDLEKVLEKIWGSKPKLKHEEKPRRRFGVRAHFDKAPALSQLALQAKSVLA